MNDKSTIQLVLGDFNESPLNKPILDMKKDGFISCMEAFYGKEPEYTTIKYR